LGRIALRSVASGEVDVLVRPEELSLETGGHGAGDGIEATVELVEFVGHDTTYLVRSDELSLQVRRPSMPVAARGDRVTIRFVGDAAAWFPAERDPA
jgi:ABC-type Fe3+/spermidine/putrescine transport system ATPase subunit